MIAPQKIGNQQVANSSDVYHADHSTLFKAVDPFIPERFIDEQGKIKKHPSFFPFGAGPRMCIGNNFAMAEISLFMHAFFQQFRIISTAQVPQMRALITLRPDKVILGIEKLILLFLLTMTFFY